MGLINNFIEKRVNKAINELTMRNNFEPTNKSAKKKNFFIKAIGLINNSPIGRDTLVAPEYNFEEIRRAIETDSYIKITLDKHSRLIYKAGYYLKSENEEAIKYLKTRFRLMSYTTGKPIDILYQEIADDIVNVFIISEGQCGYTRVYASTKDGDLYSFNNIYSDSNEYGLRFEKKLIKKKAYATNVISIALTDGVGGSVQGYYVDINSNVYAINE